MDQRFMIATAKRRAKEKANQYAEVQASDFRLAPLWWHTEGLRQTTSGYGKKLTTRFRVWYRGRLRRIYASCYSNVACHYIIVRGVRLDLWDYSWPELADMPSE